MARSWALVPRPGAARWLLQHVVTLPPAGCCSQPLTRTLEEVRCRPRYVPTHPVLEVFGSPVGWPGLSGCLVRIPSFVSTASSYPHPPAVPQSVGKGSLPELRSHLLPSPPLVFLLPPTDPGSRFNLPLFPSFLAVLPARRTQPSSGLTRLLLCSIVSPPHWLALRIHPFNEATC